MYSIRSTIAAVSSFLSASTADVTSVWEPDQGAITQHLHAKHGRLKAGALIKYFSTKSTSGIDSMASDWQSTGMKLWQVMFQLLTSSGEAKRKTCKVYSRAAVCLGIWRMLEGREDILC